MKELFTISKPRNSDELYKLIVDEYKKGTNKEKSICLFAEYVMANLNLQNIDFKFNNFKNSWNGQFREADDKKNPCISIDNYRFNVKDFFNEGIYETYITVAHELKHASRSINPFKKTFNKTVVNNDLPIINYNDIYGSYFYYEDKDVEKINPFLYYLTSVKEAEARFFSVKTVYNFLKRLNDEKDMPKQIKKSIAEFKKESVKKGLFEINALTDAMVKSRKNYNMLKNYVKRQNDSNISYISSAINNQKPNENLIRFYLPYICTGLSFYCDDKTTKRLINLAIKSQSENMAMSILNHENTKISFDDAFELLKVINAGQFIYEKDKLADKLDCWTKEDVMLMANNYNDKLEELKEQRIKTK